MLNSPKSHISNILCNDGNFSFDSTSGSCDSLWDCTAKTFFFACTVAIKALYIFYVWLNYPVCQGDYKRWVLCPTASPRYLLPNRLIIAGAMKHTEHSLSQSSQLHVGTLESISPVLVKWMLLAMDHNGAAPAKHLLIMLLLLLLLIISCLPVEELC